MQLLNKYLIQHLGKVLLFVSILSLIYSLFMFSNWVESIPDLFYALPNLMTPSVRFSFFSLDDFIFYEVGTNKGYRSVSTIIPMFFFYMLIGSILYLRSGGIERRLLNFCLAVILYSSFISIFFQFYIFSQVEFNLRNTFFISTGIIRNLIWIYIPYTFLKYLLKYQEENENNHQEEVLASKSERLVHWLIDIIIAISCTSGILYSVVRTSFNYSFLGQYTLHFWVALLIVVYYLFFECLFKTSAGKMFTESKVKQVTKNDLGFKDIALRSFARMIPFEAFSIFFGEAMLHDSLSQTKVIRQRYSKIPLDKYIIYFLLSLLIYPILIIGMEEFERRSLIRLSRRLDQEFIREQDLMLNNLKENDILILKNLDYEPINTFRIKQVTNDSVIGALFAVEHPYVDEVEFYLNNVISIQDNLLLDTFALSELSPAILRRVEIHPSIQQLVPIGNIETNNLQCRIKKVFRNDDPIISYLNSNRVSDSQLNFKNKGWASDLIDIIKVEGDFTINTELPMLQVKNKFSLGLEGITYYEDYVFDLVFQNSHKVKSIFRVILKQDSPDRVVLIDIIQPE